MKEKNKKESAIPNVGHTVTEIVLKGYQHGMGLNVIGDSNDLVMLLATAMAGYDQLEPVVRAAIKRYEKDGEKIREYLRKLDEINLGDASNHIIRPAKMKTYDA